MGVLGVLKASGDIRYPQGFLSTGVLFLMFFFFHFGRDQVLIAVSWSHQTVKRINNWFVDFNLSVLSVVLDRLYCHPGTGIRQSRLHYYCSKEAQLAGVFLILFLRNPFHWVKPRIAMNNINNSIKSIDNLSVESTTQPLYLLEIGWLLSSKKNPLMEPISFENFGGKGWQPTRLSSFNESPENRTARMRLLGTKETAQCGWVLTKEGFSRASCFP